MPASRSLCKYTWKLDIYMVLTGKGCLEPSIWPKTPQQAESTENMMKIILSIEAMRQQKASGKPDWLLTPTGKETKHMRAILIYD